MKAPLFSILIPSYNRPEFLCDAVESVLASTLSDFEIIVSDDCSPRQSEIAAGMVRYQSDGRVHFVTQPRNLGEPTNRAFLTQAARGEWLLILSDDDKLYPHALETLGRAITAAPNARLFTFGYTLIDEHGIAKYSRRAPRCLPVHRDDAWVLAEFLVSDAFPYWLYQPATFCAHRTVGERIQPNPTIGMGDDLQYLFDYVNDGGTMVVVPDVLMCYRKFSAEAVHHQRNQSAAPLANFRTRYLMLRAFEERPDLCPQVYSVVSQPDFRRRFVYQAAASEGLTLGRILSGIEMAERHRQELLEFYHRRHRWTVRVAGYFRRARLFHRLFGLAGLAEIARVLFERIRYRLRARR